MTIEKNLERTTSWLNHLVKDLEEIDKPSYNFQHYASMLAADLNDTYNSPPRQRTNIKLLGMS